MKSVQCINCDKEIDVDALIDNAHVDESSWSEESEDYRPGQPLTYLMVGNCPHCDKQFFIHYILEPSVVEIDDGDEIGAMFYQQSINWRDKE